MQTWTLADVQQPCVTQLLDQWVFRFCLGADPHSLLVKMSGIHIDSDLVWRSPSHCTSRWCCLPAVINCFRKWITSGGPPIASYHLSLKTHIYLGANREEPFRIYKNISVALDLIVQYHEASVTKNNSLYV